MSVLVTKYDVNCDGDTSAPTGHGTDSVQDRLLRKFSSGWTDPDEAGNDHDRQDGASATSGSSSSRLSDQRCSSRGPISSFARDDEHFASLRSQLSRDRQSIDRLDLCTNKLYDHRTSLTVDSVGESSRHQSLTNMRSYVHGDPPLILACQSLTTHHAQCVDMLLSLGADINIGGTNGRTALHAACVAASAVFIDDLHDSDCLDFGSGGSSWGHGHASDDRVETTNGVNSGLFDGCGTYLTGGVCTREPLPSPMLKTKKNSGNGGGAFDNSSHRFSPVTTGVAMGKGPPNGGVLQADKLRVLRGLLQRGANPEAPDAEGVTPLMLAASISPSPLPPPAALQPSTNP